jgi:DNA primase
MVKQLGKGRDVVIIADKDEPGMEGARALKKIVLPNARSAVIVQPPGVHKDLREWVRAGGNRDALRFIVESIRGY